MREYESGCRCFQNIVSVGTAVAGCNQNTSRLHVDVCFSSRNTQCQHTLTEHLVFDELSPILPYLVCKLKARS